MQFASLKLSCPTQFFFEQQVGLDSSAPETSAAVVASIIPNLREPLSPHQSEHALSEIRVEELFSRGVGAVHFFSL
jgi:hypothetical protein